MADRSSPLCGFYTDQIVLGCVAYSPSIWGYLSGSSGFIIAWQKGLRLDSSCFPRTCFHLRVACVNAGCGSISCTGAGGTGLASTC